MILSNTTKNPDFNYKKEPEFKFEEDIITPFHSKFSASTKFEFKPQQKPKLETWQDILSVFPNLLDLGISPTENLLPVNGFMAKEFSYELGNLNFGNGNESKTEISLWYLSNETDKNFSLSSIANKVPLIVEFDIDVKANETSADNGTLLYEFTPSFLQEIKTFYTELQNEGIIDLNANTTKTDYVYKHLNKDRI